MVDYTFRSEKLSLRSGILYNQIGLNTWMYFSPDEWEHRDLPEEVMTWYHMHTLSIPVSLKYCFAKVRGVRVFITPGTGQYYEFRSNSHTERTVSDKVIKSYDRDEFYGSHYTAFALGAGIEIPIGKKTSIFLEPTATRYIYTEALRYIAHPNRWRFVFNGYNSYSLSSGLKYDL